jgi:hypothetical protein
MKLESRRMLLSVNASGACGDLVGQSRPKSLTRGCGASPKGLSGLWDALSLPNLASRLGSYSARLDPQSFLREVAEPIYGITLNGTLLVSVQVGVATVTNPEVAPDGTVA